MLAECRVGKGRLMMSSIDFTTDMDERMVSRNLYAKILDYMNSEHFSPEFELTESVVLSVLGGTENNLAEMGAKVKSQNRKQTLLAQMLVDGDVTTVWNMVSDKKAPQWMTVNFTKAELLKGFRLIFRADFEAKTVFKTEKPVGESESLLSGENREYAKKNL